MADAQAAHVTLQTLESMGGVDGVGQTISEIEEVDELLRTGDPAAIDKILEVAGEGFDKIAPAMLDKLQTSNPEAYAATIRPHLVKAIAGTGISEHLAAAFQDFEMSKTPGATQEFKDKFEQRAFKRLAGIHTFLGELGKSDEAPAGKPDPRAEQLTQREQVIAAKEAEAFNTDIGNQANPKMNTSLQKALTPYISKMTPAQKADLTQGVYDEFAKLVKADKTTRNKDALFKSKKKDAASIARLMTNKFDSVVNQAVKNVVGRRYAKAVPAKAAPAPAPVGKTPVKGVGSLQSPIQIKETPDRKDVDWSKTTDQMTMKGIRILKTGKVVQVVE